MGYNITIVPSIPYHGQRPGTSGLRKPVKSFKQKSYTENFVQCILDALIYNIEDSVLVVGGDGRYYCKEATDIIIKMCAANGVSKVIVGKSGILSTPAASALIRSHKTTGGILLTASHNPGGIDNDFGIKFNLANGGPAPDYMTNKVFLFTTECKSYKIVTDLTCDIEVLGVSEYDVNGVKFTVEVIDPVDNYVELMKTVFDFPSLKTLFEGETPLRILIDSMSGVTGPYVERIFLKELKAPVGSVVNTVPLEDFGGKHPDPNLTYAAELVQAVQKGDLDFGAAYDGDGDRNMILGQKGFFVNPSDSLAVIADNLETIPYFQRTKIKGFARSMPTGRAVDKVAEEKGLRLFEVPTGWKYFGSLMDAGKLSLCGEESFGTGSDHIREKDGIWASLAWLTIIKERNLSINNILLQHWIKYGRNFFTRYDYEDCDIVVCNSWFNELEQTVTAKNFTGSMLSYENKSYKVRLGDNFFYRDFVDGSTASNQGLRVIFDDGSRIVYRLSGTGSTGATVRMYVEGFEYEEERYTMDVAVVLHPLIQIGLRISKLVEKLEREKPTVIT